MRVLLFGLAIAAVPVAMVVAMKSVVLAVLIVFASHMLLLYPTLRPGSQWWGPVVQRFRSTSEVWLTIDDGPDPNDTPRLLELFSQHGARATFFVKGENARRWPELIERIVAEGHSVGNHSDTHPSGTFWCLPPRALAQQIDQCNAAIAKSTGTAPRIFRPPVGMKNWWVHPLLRSRGLRLIGWSARGFDGAPNPQPDQVVARIERDLQPGAIVLLHEGRGDTSIEIIRRVLALLEEKKLNAIIPTNDSLLPAERQ